MTEGKSIIWRFPDARTVNGYQWCCGKDDGER